MNALVNLHVAHPDESMFKTASNALSMAKSYQIDSTDMRDLAAQELTKIKGLQKDIDAKRKSITKPIDEAKKMVMDLFRQPVEFLEKAESVLKNSIMTFDAEQRKIVLAEQAKLEEAARRERERIQKEAAAREAETRAEVERLKAEQRAAESSGSAEDASRLAVEARQREEQGDIEANALMQISALVTAPVVAAPRQTNGVSSRTVWKATVDDKLALIKFIASNPEYVDLLDVNMPAVNKIALALRTNCPLDGVRVFEETVIAARAA